MSGGVLYHGTSQARRESILRDGMIRRAQSGPAKVALTNSVDVAAYWAALAADTDRQDGRGDGAAVVLCVDADQVSAEVYSDPIWGDGECDWEREVAVWGDVPCSAIVGWFTPSAEKMQR